jgi:class 3 adenylate cyclase
MTAESSARSLFDEVVERYAAITAWPTSRKTALLSGLMAVTLLPILALTQLLTPRLLAHVVDAPQLVPLAAAWVAVTLGFFALSLAVARAGRDGRPIAYLYVCALIPLYHWLFHLYGMMSTPLLAIYPMAVLLLMLFFDPRVAWFTFFLSMAFVAVQFALELGGIIPFAPILLDRRIDAQRSAAWYLNIYVVIQSAFLLPLVLVHFTIAANRSLRHQLLDHHARIVQSNQNLERANEVIRRYVPAQVAARILSGEQAETIRPERRKLTLFFSDIVGFTAAADRLEAEDLAAVLNEYLAEMAGIADAWGATIDQFVGDGIMIFFGAPDATDDRDHAVRCVRMAIAMQRRVRELRSQWFAAGIEEPFHVRIGINTGTASVGDFGSAGRIAYSAVGTQTNLAARIQDACTPGRILISHSTWALVHDVFPCVERGSLEAKGLHYPVRVYEVIDDRSSADGEDGPRSRTRT